MESNHASSHGASRSRAPYIVAFIVTAIVAVTMLSASLPFANSDKLQPIELTRQAQRASLIETAQASGIDAQGNPTGNAKVPAAHLAEAALPKVTSNPEGSSSSPWQGVTRLNILLLGIDERPGGDADKANTDTMIVLTVDPATHTAGMLSLPRDLYVTLPNHTEGRINTAQAIGGPSYSMQTVSSLLGIPIQHYVRVDFSAVVTLVDLVGGVDVYVDQDINDPTYPNMNYGFDPFVINKGMHHMDGATALKYARTRHGSSDFVRMQRQQQIIMALRERALSTGAIPQLLPRLPILVSTLSDSISTDLNLSEMVHLLTFAKDLQLDQIKRVVVDESAASPWTTPHGGAVLLPNIERIHQLVKDLTSPPVDIGRQIQTQR